LHLGLSNQVPVTKLRSGWLWHSTVSWTYSIFTIFKAYSHIWRGRFLCNYNSYIDSGNHHQNQETGLSYQKKPKKTNTPFYTVLVMPILFLHPCSLETMNLFYFPHFPVSSFQESYMYGNMLYDIFISEYFP
jgi:hypothetical protein